MLRILALGALFLQVGLGMEHTSHKSRGDEYDYADSGDVDYGGGYDEDEEELEPNTLLRYQGALTSLFGSDEYLADEPYQNYGVGDYVQLAIAEFKILQAVDKPENYSRLNSTQKEEIIKVMEIMEERMVKSDEDAKKKWLVDTLICQAKKLTDILPTSAIVGHLEDLAESPESAYTNCESGYLVSLWREIIEMTSKNNNISDSSVDFAIEGLVQTGQSIRNVTTHKGYISKAEVRTSKDRIKLLSMLSQKRNRMFAVRNLGGIQPLEDLVQSILCEQLKLSLVKGLLEKFADVQGQDFAKRLITNPEDMTALIEMQETLGVVTNDVAEIEKHLNGRQRTIPDLGQQLLNAYMDLVDTAVNEETVKIWAQMSPEEANAKLHQLLLSNEQYVGSVSDVILHARTSEKSYQLEKEAVSVSISKVHLDEGNKDTTTEFKYEDTYIKTDDIAQLSPSEGDDLRVYTLRYKSWSDMLRDILLKHFDLEKNGFAVGNQTRRKRSIDESVDQIMSNKSFIGKGGVVSLSVKQNGVKRSLPATYWIGFNNATSSDSENAKCLQLSCEYLDPDTISWESRGCRVESVTRFGITCKCNHTTNFAAFMMPVEPIRELTKEESMALKVMSKVGSFLSVCGLLATLTVFFLVRHLVRNDRFKAHAHLSFSLLVVNITYLLGELLISNNVICVISTMVSHYFLLATFMWMLIEGIFLYLYVVQVFLRSKVVSYNWMYFVGWGIPVVIVAISAGYGIPNDIYVMPAINSSRDEKTADISCPTGTYQYPPVPVDSATTEESIKYERCWLSTESGVIWAILTPAVLVLAFNTAIMCKTLMICVKSLRNQQRMRAKSESLLHSGHHSNSSSSKNSSSRTHTDSFSDLHGRPGPPSRQISAPSPCLLQVTTEEEEKNKILINEETSFSSTDNVSPTETNAKDSLKQEYMDIEKPRGSRYHSVGGNSLQTSKKQGSVMYRNSVSKQSPKFSTKTKSIGSNMVQLTSERVGFFRDAKAAVKGAIILLPILGLPWILGFFAPWSVAIMFMFVILNSTQGIAIFVVYGLCNGEIRRALKRRSAVRNMKLSVDSGGFRRTSSTSTARSFLRFGRRRSTVLTTT